MSGRAKAVVAVFGSVVAGLVILGITLAIWDADQKRSDRRQEVIKHCIDAGNIWVYDSCLVTHKEAR